MVDVTKRQKEILAFLPATADEIATHFGIDRTTAYHHIGRLRDKEGINLNLEEGVYYIGDSIPLEPDINIDPLLEELDTVELGDSPQSDNLTPREKVLISELQTGSTLEELTERVNSRPEVITAHLKELKRSGWQVYLDETSGMVAIEGDHVLRSSEHKGTRTRKANRWWELRHNSLVREFRNLQTPAYEHDYTPDHEDWVTHITDLHAGDRVRNDDGTVVFETKDIPPIVDYITERSISLSEKHGSNYDTSHLLWGGDFITNSGIYEGQFEDLDAWLDEQHEILMNPLMRQLKAFSEHFPSVNVVCQVGNHGDHRASGTSKQANADLILYKSIRNVVSHLQTYCGELENVSFQIGQATPYKNFELRGGKLRGHLRHGQNRRPQADTSARMKQWLSTLYQHQFDAAFVGHYHVSGRIPWDGPPIIYSASPKPAGEYVERMGSSARHGEQGVATACGFSDEGLTAVFPIDTRNY